MLSLKSSVCKFLQTQTLKSLFANTVAVVQAFTSARYSWSEGVAALIYPDAEARNDPFRLLRETCCFSACSRHVFPRRIVSAISVLGQFGNSSHALLIITHAESAMQQNERSCEF